MNELEHLKNTVETLAAEHLEEESETLKEAFSLFSKETMRLEKAYKDLKKRFSLIEKKLQESYFALQEKNTQLELTTKNFEIILSHMAQGILFINREKKIQAFNQAAKHILGNSVNDPTFIEEQFDFSLDLALSEGVMPQSGYHTLTLDGQNKEIELCTSYVKSSIDQGVQGIIFLIKDMTEMRHLQAAARRNDRLKELGEMAARLAHEIRNPLSGMQGFATLLMRDLVSMPQQKEMATAIVEGTNLLNNLVSSVLDYTKPLQINFATVDLVKLLNKMLPIFKIQKKPDIRLEITTRCHELKVMADPDLIYSAFLNLVLNAFQAIEKSGTVTITIEQKQQTGFIIFSDTGIGITKESIEKLFTPFFTTKKQGNGLGLAETHKIIEAHDGKIEVLTELGKGTSFIVSLPVQL